MSFANDRHHRLFAFLSGITAAAVLAASGAAMAPRPAAADDVITFGAALSATGRDAREGALTKEGYDFWKDYINSQGGIKVGGKMYKVDIKYYDDASDPATSAKLVERLITQDNVKFILAPYGSAATFAASAIVEKYQVPMVDPNGAAEKIFNQGYHYTFAILSPAKKYLQGILELGQTLKPRPTTVAVLAANDQFSLEVADGIRDYAKKNGFNEVFYSTYPPDTQDVATLLTQVKAQNPDIILGSGHLQDSLLIMRAAKDQNVQSKIIGFSVGPSTPDFITSLGNDSNGVMGGAQWTITLNYTDPLFGSAARYTKMFEAKYNHVPDYHNAESTAACETFQFALAKAGDLDPAKVRDALAAL
ncbi:MAG: amino acid ABC transporter substrate-binding protein, partial [Candidatus Eremiobacteraeota bacterium]|nr:amino acid ABC transporter substrate-binding protein [Candidatus Eremiobacteraeota bacterium]